MTLSSSADDPIDLYLAAGRASVSMSLRSASGAIFNISGDASTAAPVADDRVSALLPASGVFLDTTESQGNCTVSYSSVSATDLGGIATCTVPGVSGGLTADFHAS